MRQIVAPLSEHLELTGFDRPVVVGQSWGGNVVVELAATTTVPLRGIACVDGGFIDLREGLIAGARNMIGIGVATAAAGTGYQHTLFDSADNKCQHCHNDLYDTWKTSMHAKSWKDPIFQSKYQDFLRLQASKIGAKGPTGTYQEGTIQKTGQVCIKCHAPTAFYSGDYKITLTEVGDMNTDEGLSYDEAKALQTNLAPAYNSDLEATVSSMAKTGKVYTVSYHIGNGHNREGINCAYCHSMETVRLMNDMDGDQGLYTLANDIKMGPIGPVVREEANTATKNRRFDSDRAADHFA